MAGPRRTIMPKRPMAWACSSGGKVSRMMAWAMGRTAPPPSPWSVLKAMSWPRVGHPTEARGDREEGDRQQVESPAAEDGAEPRGEGHDDDEGDEVTRDDPGDLVGSDPVGGLDVRKRDVDDAGVDGPHEGAQEYGEEDGPLARLPGAESVVRCPRPGDVHRHSRVQSG